MECCNNAFHVVLQHSTVYKRTCAPIKKASLLLEPMTEFPIDFRNTSLYAEKARKS